MIGEYSNTVILLFTRSATEEITHKSFVGGSQKRDLRIVEQLIGQAKAAATKTGLPLYLSNRIQTGTSFGERLGNEMQRLFDLGLQ